MHCSKYFIKCWILSLIFVSTKAWQAPLTRRQAVVDWGILALTTVPSFARAEEGTKEVVRIQVRNSNDSLSVQIKTLEGERGVAVERVVSSKFPNLHAGMKVKGFRSSEDLLERLASGPYPLELEFEGDSSLNPSKAASPPVTESSSPRQLTYIKRVTQEAPGPCAIQSQRGDLLEIEYEARYVTQGSDKNTRKVLYDASSFRGTGQPYQMVLGSGDMIPGVDQGLVAMCPGESRLLEIPPPLAYGPRARDLYRIPIDYQGVEWIVSLVSIDGSIRSDNNNLTRLQREANYSE